MRRTKTRQLHHRRHVPVTGAAPAPQALCVQDIMTRELITVSPDLSLRELVELLADEHVSGAPVVSGDEIIGVISASDVLGFEASTPGIPVERPDQVEEAEWEPVTEWEAGTEAPGAFFSDWWEDAGADVAERFEEVGSTEWDLLREHVVAEAMTRRLFTIEAAAGIADAAEYMLRARIHRLLVREGGKFVGIVSTTDIMRAVAMRKLLLT